MILYEEEGPSASVSTGWRVDTTARPTGAFEEAADGIFNHIELLDLPASPTHLPSFDLLLVFLPSVGTIAAGRPV